MKLKKEFLMLKRVQKRQEKAKANGIDMVQVCRVCGHEPCQGCEVWCDVVTPTDDDFHICCDGLCDLTLIRREFLSLEPPDRVKVLQGATNG